MGDLFDNLLPDSLLPEENLTVKTDQVDYAPGSTANFTITGIGVGETVQLDVVETVAGDDGVLNTYDPFTVTDGGTNDLDGLANGQIVTAWLVPADPDGDGPQVASALNATLQLTATAMGADGAIGGTDDRVATTTFTDATGSTNKVYQHWADQVNQPGGASWQGDILNAGKSDYFEGEVIPHVFVYKASNNAPLVNGQSYSFNITYNYYQANTNAGGFAYITTYNVSRQPGPNDATNPYVAPTVDNSFTNGGGFTAGGNSSGFYTVDANITGVSGVTYTGSGTTDGVVTVTFTYTGTTTSNGIAEIYYGLYIANPGQVPNQGSGTTQGASAWTGGSLQTTVDIGGSGATSIQLSPDAIIDGEISGMKFNDLNGNGVKDAGELGLAGWTIYLDNNNNGVKDTGEVSTVTDANGNYSFSVTPDANKSTTANDPYYVREVNQAGWTQTSPTSGSYGPLTVTATTPQYLDQNFGNFQNINLSGYKWNDLDGDGVWDANEQGLANWTIQLDKNNDGTIDATTTTDATGKYTFTNLGPGNYKVTEQNQAGWTQTFGNAGYTFTATSGQNLAGTSGTASSYDFGNKVTFVPNPNFTIAKDVSSVTGGAGLSADSAGDIINYNIVLTNTGNQNLTGVTLSDPFATSVSTTHTDTGLGTHGDNILDVGEVWTYTASHTVTQAELDAGATLVNVATGDTDQTAPKSDDATTPVVQSKVLHIEKDATVPGGTANVVGEVISYTMAVTNTGNAAIAGVQVDDAFTSNEAPVLSGGFNTGDSDQDGKLDVGETWQYTASHTVTQAELDAGGNIVNTATVTGNGATPDSDDAIIPVVQNKVLHIEKDGTVADGTADAAGDVINYTMAVTNTGNAAIAGVQVDDAFTSNEAPVLSGGFNTGDSDQDGKLDVGETWQYTASHTVTQAELDAGGNIVNTAIVTGTGATSDDDDASVPVAQNKVLHIEKDATVPGGTANVVGEVISYTMAVTNTGNAAISDVQVDDAFTSDEAPVLTGGFNTGDTDQDGKLDVGETWQYTASHTITQAELDAGGNIVNTAIVTGTGATSDDDDASVPVAQNKVLHIEKDATVPGGTANVVGEVISYTMAVTNTGNAAISDVQVDDAFTSNEAPVLTGGFNIGDVDQDSLLDVNETWQYTASHTVTQAELDAGGNIVNTAIVTGTGATPDDDDASVPVAQNKVLQIEKDATVPGGTANVVGEVISYTMSVTNTGNAAISDVQVDDAFTSDEAPVLTGGFNTGDTDQDGKLDVGETWQYTASHTVTQAELDAGGNIVNTAIVTGTGATPDDDDASVPVAQNKVLQIEKDATVPGGTANVVGEVISYTMAVTNTGNAAISDVQVDDAFTSNEAPVLSGGFNIGDVDQDSLLDVNETWQYTASHTVTQAELDAGGNIVNTATVTGNGATPDSDDAIIPVVQNKVLHIEKDGTVADGTADAAGDVINYTMAVTNTGNAAIAGVQVDDAFTSNEAPVLTGGFNIGDVDQDSLLDVNETWQYTASHTVTQAELDAGGNIVNTAIVTGTGATSDDDDASVPVAQNKVLHIEKDGTVADGTADAAGDVINYTMAVTNTGNAAIAGVQVDDAFTSNEAPVLSGGFNIGDVDQDSLLDVNETWQYTASHTVTQAELDAGGNIVNTAIVTGTGATSDDDDASVPVAQNKVLQIEKDATVPGGTANVVGEVISYTMAVTNTGNAAIAGVQVDDAFTSNEAPVLSGGFNTGDSDQDGKLDVGETWQYTASHTVTQAELDAGGNIVNTAIVTGTGATSDDDDASVPVAQNKVLHIEKDATVPGGTANVVGEVISYTMSVTNTGNAAIAGVQVDDAFTSNEAPVLSGGFNTGDSDQDGKLDVGETWQYTASHTVTQAELDAGGNIVNTAIVTGTGATPDDDDAIIPVVQNPNIAINKVTVYGAQTGDNLNGVTAGTPISWNYTVTNPGNVSLSNVTVKDDNGTPTNSTDDFFASPTLSGGFNIGDANHDGKLNPGESWTFTKSGTAVAGSYSNIGTASGTIGTTTKTATDPSSYFGTADVGQIAPTGATINQYINGTAPDFDQYYASQGGAIQYGTNKNKISQTNPGVFFYYTGLSNTIKGFDGPDAGTAPDQMSILIDQSNNGPDVVSSNANPGNTEWNFSTVQNNINLYKVTDANNNGKIDAGEAATKVSLQSSQIVFGTGANKGDVTINFTPDAVGSLYVVGVKYDTSSVVGLPEGTRPTVKYTFNTDVGNNGTIEETDLKGITLSYKAPLTLDAAATTGGAMLTQDQLAPVVSAAIDYWAAQGVNAQSLNHLRQTDVLIGDLGGTSLGETLGEPDGLIVKIDDDADGYGWSTSLDNVNPNQVDLFSTLTHEFGHILGLDHDVMGEALGVGERHLPLAGENLDLLQQQYSNVFAVQTHI